MEKFKVQTLLLRISWIFLLLTGIGILGFGLLVSAYPQIAGAYDAGLLRAYGIVTIGMGLFGTAITLVSFRRRESWAWFILWYYPIFWTLHLVAALPPGNDHIHQVVFIAISMAGLILPFSQFFPREGS